MTAGGLARLLMGALALAVGGSVVTASAASIATPVTSATHSTRGVTANDLKPAACAGITVTAVVSGSGVITGQGSVSELITGSAGADTISGLGGDDCILAGAGDDIVGGGNGNDVVLGQAGNDTLDGDRNNDTVYGGSGDDVLTGGQGTDVCDAGGDPGDTFGDNSCETEIP
jgi:Ca2+-binding RTX toxin-like protein